MSTLLTKRYGWSTVRDAISSDDTALTKTTKKNANIPNHAYTPISSQNNLEIAWTMGAEGQSCTVNVYAAREGSDIALLWSGTLTAGAQESTDGRYYVDTLSSTTDNWMSTVSEIDIAGNDRMSRIAFDTAGYSKFFCVFGNLSSESVKAYYSGF